MKRRKDACSWNSPKALSETGRMVVTVGVVCVCPPAALTQNHNPRWLNPHTCVLFQFCRSELHQESCWAHAGCRRAASVCRPWAEPFPGSFRLLEEFRRLWTEAPCPCWLSAESYSWLPEATKFLAISSGRSRPPSPHLPSHPSLVFCLHFCLEGPCDSTRLPQ